MDALEGGPAPLRVVVIEFPDAAAARGWYESAEYQEILPLRQRASTADVLLVESAG